MGKPPQEPYRWRKLIVFYLDRTGTTSLPKILMLWKV